MTKLKELRKNYGMTQEELGNEIGRSAKTISRLERRNQKMTEEYAHQFAEIFKVDADIFFKQNKSLRKKITDFLFGKE